MTFLLVCKQKKNLDTFEAFVAALLAGGHRVVLTIQERDAARDARIVEQFNHPLLTVVSCPDGRSDDWRPAAPLVRTARDWAQYVRPPYRQASKLADRAAARLARELGAASGDVARPTVLGAGAAARVIGAFARVERAIPRDPLHDEFVRSVAPDVVLVTPGLHFGSGQADFVKSAQGLGIPAWMLLFSWDNLSTKGALHVAPDLMFVWNERQRREAAELHDYPSDRIVVVGAPRFDPFFALRSVITRRDFFVPLGLDPAVPTLLYLCSSRFIADDEPRFIASWLRAVRGAGGRLATCNVLIRPHPDVPFEAAGTPDVVHWRGLPQATGWAHRPFDDPRALVLRTTYRTQEAFFECLHHADAVVALNTSAELEAGIAGRPVFTVLANDQSADGQAQTLHFNYLLREHGGFVSYAPSLRSHVAQLESALAAPPPADHIQRFVREFLRPLGDEPVAPLLARMVAARAATATGNPAPGVGLQAPEDPAPGAELQAPEQATAVRRLRLAPDSAVTILASPETKRWRRDGVYLMAPSVRAWLESEVRPGDTFHDVGAGVGPYALFAARHRGCTAVAFEPGFAAFATLCENVIHNECGRTVLPIPAALAATTGLVELDYPHEAGSDQHTTSTRVWRGARAASDARYVQPVCAETLDAMVFRQGLPPPHAIRLAVRRQPEAVLQGAAQVLASAGMRSVLCQLRSREQAEAVRRILQAGGYEGSDPVEDGDHGVILVFSRDPHAVGGPAGAFRRLQDALGSRRRGT
jgi:FkbM family methyltransferase